MIQIFNSVEKVEEGPSEQDEPDLAQKKELRDAEKDEEKMQYEHQVLMDGLRGLKEEDN